MPLGRPPILDDVKRGEICALLSAGLAMREAARYVGCAVRTIRRELQHNDEFRFAVRDAELAARFDPETQVRRAATSNWRAAAWLLERTNPRRFARRPVTACHPDDLEEACERIMEAGLAEFDTAEGKRRAYVRMSAAAEDATRAMIERGGRATTRRIFTPITDAERLDHQIDLAVLHRRAVARRVEAERRDAPPDSSPNAETYDETVARISTGLMAALRTIAARSPEEKSREKPHDARRPRIPGAPSVDKSRPPLAAPEGAKPRKTSASAPPQPALEPPTFVPNSAPAAEDVERANRAHRNGAPPPSPNTA